MKIAIAGSHGVGKTTLAKALAQRLNLNYIPDIVREEAIPKGFVINENTPPEVQLWLVTRQWELERLTGEDWVADKSLLDYLVYGDIVLKDEGLKGIIKGIVERNARYDLVFYLPIEFPMENDGLRSADEAFREEVDRRYRIWLDNLRIPYIVVSGAPEERLNRALAHLQNG